MGLEIRVSPSQLPAPLSPRCCWLCFARRVPWRAHSSFLPLGCSFSETERTDEFHFRSGLRGEESLSCLAQGWDALNKGGVSAVKIPLIVGGGWSVKTGVPLQHITTQQYTRSSVPCHCACASQRSSLRSRGSWLQVVPLVIAELCFMIRAHIVTRRAWGGRSNLTWSLSLLDTACNTIIKAKARHTDVPAAAVLPTPKGTIKLLIAHTEIQQRKRRPSDWRKYEALNNDQQSAS